MAIELPMSFLHCEVDLDSPGEKRLLAFLPKFRKHIRPYVKEITFRWSDPSRRENRPLLDEITGLDIPFIIRTEGSWSDPGWFLRKASGIPMLEALAISGFDERIIPCDERDVSFFTRLELFGTIRQARSMGLPVKALIPLRESTEKYLEEILEAACECGAETAVLERRPHNFSGEKARGAELQRTMAARLRSLAQEGWPLSFAGCMPFGASRGYPGSCGAGITCCFITSDGGVYPCEHAETPVGNILEAPLHSFYDTEAVKAWRSRKHCTISGFPDYSALSRENELTLPIQMDECLEAVPRYELRKGLDYRLLVFEKDSFPILPGDEALFRFLFKRPALREIALIHGEASLRKVFSLYLRGFLSFAAARVRPAGDEQPHGMQRRGKGDILDFNQNLLLWLSPEAMFRRKRNRVLILHPQSASFHLAPLSLCYMVRSLAEPCYFDDFCRDHEWLGREKAENLVRSLYIEGIIEVNGICFWNEALPEPPEEKRFIECSLLALDEHMNRMGEKTLRHILKALEVHYRGMEKRLELIFEKNDGTLEEWLSIFFRELGNFAFSQAGESRVRLLVKELPLNEGILGLLREHSASLEIHIREGNDPDPELIKRISGLGIPVILTIAAETPAAALKKLRSFRSTGASALRFEPCINHGDFMSVDEWLKAYVRIFEALYSPGGKGAPGAPTVMNFEDLLADRHRNKRRGSPCSCRPCGAGSHRLAFSVKGDLFPCPRMMGREEFNCGPVRSKASPERRASRTLEKILGSGTAGPARCRKCFWRALCPGECPVVCREHRRAPGDPYPACGFTRHMMEELSMRVIPAAVPSIEAQGKASTGSCKQAFSPGTPYPGGPEPATDQKKS
ncbi:MAG: SPASM domain-containing protein [Candidatus Eremiobacteraeota bacterium]|nr:SPASM domain-containing protein [Candidatus Eremiobacteraeota bacterium]